MTVLTRISYLKPRQTGERQGASLQRWSSPPASFAAKIYEPMCIQMMQQSMVDRGTSSYTRTREEGHRVNRDQSISSHASRCVAFQNFGIGPGSGRGFHLPKTRHHAAPGRAAGRWLVHPYPAFGLEDAPAKPPAPQGRRGKESGRGKRLLYSATVSR